MNKYWIIVEGKPQGPFSVEQLRGRSDFTASLPVWTASMRDWTVAGEVAELIPYLNEETTSEPEPVGNYVEETVEEAPKAELKEETAWINPLRREINGESRPSTYLGWNIVMTMCCCMPAGIVGIIYSYMVNQRWLRGDVKGAKRASEVAAWCLILSFTLGLVCWPFQLLFQMM